MSVGRLRNSYLHFHMFKCVCACMCVFFFPLFDENCSRPVGVEQPLIVSVKPPAAVSQLLGWHGPQLERRVNRSTAELATRGLSH